MSWHAIITWHGHFFYEVYDMIGFILDVTTLIGTYTKLCIELRNLLKS
jgi:hypothetical protein